MLAALFLIVIIGIYS